MKRLGLVFGTMVLLLAAATTACNGVLGIGSAALEGVEAGAVEGGTPDNTCASYCHLITQNCTINAQEYQSEPMCLSMCNNLALDNGVVGPGGENTLGCRIYYADLAGRSDPAGNCRFAGPLGGGHCGDKAAACTNFCSLDVPYCRDIIKMPSYASQVDCMNDCIGVDGGTGYDFETDGGSTGVDLPASTNTLNCRFYHLENAYPDKTRGAVHCPHTMPVSATCN